MAPPDFDNDVYYALKEAITNKSEQSKQLGGTGRRRNKRIESQFSRLDREDGVCTVGARVTANDILINKYREIDQSTFGSSASKMSMQMSMGGMKSDRERDSMCPTVIRSENIKMVPANPIGQDSYAFTISGGDVMSNQADGTQNIL